MGQTFQFLRIQYVCVHGIYDMLCRYQSELEIFNPERKEAEREVEGLQGFFLSVLEKMFTMDVCSCTPRRTQSQTYNIIHRLKKGKSKRPR